MATKISQLPAAIASAVGDLLATTQSIAGVLTTGKVALSQIAAWAVQIYTAFTQAGTHAGAMTVQGKLQQYVSAADFTDGSGNFFAAGSTAAQNAAALNNAIATLGTAGGLITIPAGTFNVAADTVTFPYPNVTLSGAGNGMGYGAPSAATNIVFATGTVGFDLTTISGTGAAGNYTLLRYMNINGNNACKYPIKAEGLILLEHINVTGSTSAGAGLWLYDYINQAKLSHVSVIGNNGYGLLIGGGTGNNTVMSFDHFVARSNLVGVRITNAYHMTMKDAVIESNTHEGLQLYVDIAGSGGAVSYCEFDNAHFENNYAGGSSSNYNVVISNSSGTATDGPTFCLFRNARFNASGSTGGVNVVEGYSTRFENCDGSVSATLTLGANSTSTSTYNWNGGTISDSSNRSWQSSDDRSMGTTSTGGGLLFSKIVATTFNALPVSVPTSFIPSITIGGSSTGITYGTQKGRYIQINGITFFDATIVLTSKNSLTGQIAVLLPATSAAAGGYVSLSVTCDAIANTLSTQPTALIELSGTTALLNYMVSGTLTAFGGAQILDSTSIFFSGCFASA